MKKIILLLTIVLAGLQYATAQKVTVTGVVTSQEDGLPVIGASVIEKGTSNGAITDMDGNYFISVPAGAVLEFTYLGMKPQNRQINEGGQIDIVLVPDAVAISEVVVTAMGVKTEKKRLNFAVQGISGNELSEKKATNFVNALQGKIAGLSVSSSGGSPNAGSQVIIRGISSINASRGNEPLMVIDGMPVRGHGSSMGDINPNDIESVTVLKGAAASALYGQEANGSVIMITTKRGQIGKVTATANASWQYDTPTRVRQLQTSYAPGAQGFYTEKAGGGWGPLLNEGQQIYDNVGNFLTNGMYQKYDFSLSGGSEKFQAYASAYYSMHDGIIPKDYRNRFGMLLKGTYNPTNTLSLTVSANISETTSRGAGGLSTAYGWPITDDITDYQLANGYPRFRYYNDVNKYDSPISPLYSRYNDWGENRTLRNILNGQLEWKPLKNLTFTGRLGYDASAYFYDGYSVPRWDDSVVYQDVAIPAAPGENATAAERAQYEKDLAAYNAFLEKYKNTPYLTEKDIENMDKASLGAYSTSSSRGQQFTALAMATYKWELSNDFGIDFLAGTDLKMNKGFSMSNSGRDFIIPGTYSLSNTNSKYIYLSDRTESHSQKRMYSYFGEIRADYKGLASLSVTSRWDWSSTIITNPYYYPSITGGLLFSELFGLQSDFFSYGKLRGNYAQVGGDAMAYLYDRRYKQFATYPDNGYGIDPTLSSADRNLTPEMTHTWEVGTDLRFFNSRTRLDLAYYATQVNNQIVTVRVSPSSGYILQTRNEGNVRNTGVEFTLEQDIIKNNVFSWTAGLNFGLNRGKVMMLPEEVAEITGTQYGDIFPSAFLGGSTTGLSGKTYNRTEDGKIICDESGFPTIHPNKNNYLGNREPKFLAGLTNTFRYNDWTLSFLFDGRLGGDVVNVTGRGLISNGQSKMLEQYRGRQVVVDGVVQQADGTYAPNTTPITLDYTTIINYFVNVSENFVEDGSYIRMNYLSLGYALPQNLAGKLGLTGLRLALTGNNLFMLTRYTGDDPTCNANTDAGGTGSAGIDNYAVPSTRSYNFSITATF
ncbi:MAG: SusC/RagA family TonB-linked outer membrane protein [Dysgonamonadaceae bacterium]|jgi:TonB-linked SusC/RagA family outer membrane protein|nr:SusC/RagA family TonB-linked outer membrane protein [Dysgonamonadaceae bacterium]